jgi:diguanylate cyclase (GGDEF)-like protein/PAS domain S-box-containing protein
VPADNDCLDDLPCGVLRCRNDAFLTLTYFNEKFLSFTGYTRGELSENFRDSLRALVLPSDFEMAMRETQRQLTQSDMMEVEYRLLRKDGTSVWVMDRGRFLKDEDGDEEFLCVLLDISQKQQNLAQLREMAQRDALTGLYNRKTVQALIEQYLRHAGERNMAALYMLDIDDFRRVNSVHGHLYADTALSDLASALKSIFRADDIVGRVGGDEMIIFLKNVPDALFSERIADEALNILRDRLDQSRHSISCSIGGAVFPRDGTDFETLYCNADKALYRAKQAGKDRFVMYDAATWGDTILDNPRACVH